MRRRKKCESDYVLRKFTMRKIFSPSVVCRKPFFFLSIENFLVAALAHAKCEHSQMRDIFIEGCHTWNVPFALKNPHDASDITNQVFSFRFRWIRGMRAKRSKEKRDDDENVLSVFLLSLLCVYRRFSCVQLVENVTVLFSTLFSPLYKKFSILANMDREALKKQIENMKYQATMERWPLSKSIAA